MQPGDRVNWAYTMRGGYCWTIPVAAVVVVIASDRVKIRVARMVEGKWIPSTKWVSETKLTPRTEHVTAVDGPQ